jgi:hypothetical protein
MIDVKHSLLRVINDPHFSRRERGLAKSSLSLIEELENGSASSLSRIEELENGSAYHWTEMARIALLREVQGRVIGQQAATKIDSFLKRHRIKRS